MFLPTENYFTAVEATQTHTVRLQTFRCNIYSDFLSNKEMKHKIRTIQPLVSLKPYRTLTIQLDSFSLSPIR